MHQVIEFLAVDCMILSFQDLKIESERSGNQFASIDIEQRPIFEDLAVIEYVHTFLKFSPLRVPVMKERVSFTLRPI